MPEEKTSLSQSARSSSLVMLCTFISRILGFARIALIGAVFGAKGTADALNAAFSVPNNLRKLLAEGALSSAFIPVLARMLVKDPSEAKRIVRKILTFQAIVIIPLCIAAILAADPLMRYVLAEFADPQLILLGAQLLRWFMAYLLLISISAVLMGVLQSHAHFLAPALTPFLFSIAVIGSVALLHRQIGPFSMAVGVLIGGLAQVLFQTPLYIKLGYSFLPDTQFRDGEFRSVLKQWLPVLATASIFTITQQVAVRFATGLPEGSASALQYAIVFWQLPFGVFSASITTVLFPKMSKEVGINDRKSLRETVAFGLRSMWAFLVPSAALLIIFREQIVNVAMHRGKFDADAAALTSRVLSGYSLGLFGVGAYTFLQRFFYSAGKYRVPLISALALAATDIALSIWLKDTRLQVAGLALANSIAFTGGCIVLTILTVKNLGGLPWKMMIADSAKVVLATVIASVYSILYLRITQQFWTPASSLLNFALLAGGGIPALAILYAVMRTFGVKAIDMITRRGR